MATNFLWAAGTSNSGLLNTAFNIMTTELESLGSGSGIISSVNGSSGLFTNSTTAQAIWADIFFFAGNPSITPTAGANLAGWFMTSPDSGTSLELTTVVPARAPDFIIPVPASATNTTSTNLTARTSGIVRVPALQFKVFVQNNLGVTMSTGATTAPFLKMATFAVQY